MVGYGLTDKYLDEESQKNIKALASWLIKAAPSLSQEAVLGATVEAVLIELNKKGLLNEPKKQD